MAIAKLVFGIFYLSGCAFADDNGVFGATFDIAERDLIVLIEEKLAKMQRSGELASEQCKIRDKIIKNIKEPEDIKGIKHTTRERVFEFDPTIELTQDLRDHHGKVFAKKGKKYNPLNYIKFTKPLIFIDGKDEKQIAWARLKLERYEFGKIILVAGSLLKLQKRLDRDIYFDQYGKLTSKLEIRQVPAIVFQEEGKKILTIREEKPLSNGTKDNSEEAEK